MLQPGCTVKYPSFSFTAVVMHQGNLWLEYNKTDTWNVAWNTKHYSPALASGKSEIQIMPYLNHAGQKIVASVRKPRTICWLSTNHSERAGIADHR